MYFAECVFECSCVYLYSDTNLQFFVKNTAYSLIDTTGDREYQMVDSFIHHKLSYHSRLYSRTNLLCYVY